MQLCIPRVDTSYTRDYILSIICRLKWGKIEKIFESKPKNNTDYRCVMISINWNDNNENSDDNINIRTDAVSERDDGNIIKNSNANAKLDKIKQIAGPNVNEAAVYLLSALASIKGEGRR